jgi:hypothetical protein
LSFAEQKNRECLLRGLVKHGCRSIQHLYNSKDTRYGITHSLFPQNRRIAFPRLLAMFLRFQNGVGLVVKADRVDSQRTLFVVMIFWHSQHPCSSIHKPPSYHENTYTLFFQDCTQMLIKSPCGAAAMLCRRIGSSFARKTYILAILVILMAFTIGATLWTIIKLRDSKVLLPLLVLLLLMAVAEGALGESELVNNDTNMC